jgi:Ca2+/Na+ antiporter
LNERVEGTLSVIAALLVLFTAMIDPRVSAGLAVGLLVAFAVYKYVHGRKRAA